VWAAPSQDAEPFFAYHVEDIVENWRRILRYLCQGGEGA
jgi:hypothetical protein